MSKQTSVLQAELDTTINTNGQQEITGSRLHTALTDMVSNDWLVDNLGNHTINDGTGVFIGLNFSDLPGGPISPNFATSGFTAIFGQVYMSNSINSNEEHSYGLISIPYGQFDWASAFTHSVDNVSNPADGLFVGAATTLAIYPEPIFLVSSELGHGTPSALSTYIVAGQIYDSVTAWDNGTPTGPNLPGVRMSVSNVTSGNYSDLGHSEYGVYISNGYLLLNTSAPSGYSPSGGEIRFESNTFSGFDGSSWIDFSGGSSLPTGSAYQGLALGSDGVTPEWRFSFLRHDGHQALDWDAAVLYDNSSLESVAWNSRILADITTSTSVDWGNRLMYDISHNLCIDWNNHQLKNGSIVIFDWANGLINDTNGGNFINLYYSLLTDQSTGQTYTTYGHTFKSAGGDVYAEIGNGVLCDATSTSASAGSISINFFSRTLNNSSLLSSPVVPMLDWSGDYVKVVGLGGSNSVTGYTSTGWSYSFATGSNSLAGQITIDVTSNTAGGIFTVNFLETYPHAVFVQLTPGNALAAAAAAVIFVTSGQTSFSIVTNASMTHGTYIWNYSVMA